MRIRRHLVLAVAAAGAVALVAVTPNATLADRGGNGKRKGPKPKPPVSVSAFLNPVVVSRDDGSEPGIDIAPDGTIYVNAIPGILSSLPTAPSFVYRSRDGGATWVKTPPGLRAAFPGGGDIDVTIAPDTGALATTDLWLGSSTVAKSSNRGDTWVAQPVQGEPGQDRQWVAATNGGVVYHAVHHLASGLVVAKSFDGGLTYVTRSVAATPVDSANCICPSGNLVAEPGGEAAGAADKVGLAYSTADGGVNFTRSTDGGLTFANVTVRGPSSNDTLSGFPIVANAGNGVLALTWMEVGKASSVTGFSLSRNWGATWSTPRYVVTSGSSVFPWVAAKGSKIGISLYHTSAAAPPDKAPESARWYESYLQSTDLGATWTGVQVVDPTPVKTGPICTSGLDCSDDRELGDFQSVTFDPLGRPNLAYNRSVDNEDDVEVRFVRGS